MRAASLEKHVKSNPGFIVWPFSSAKRDKLSQTRFELWKVTEFLGGWLRFRRFLKMQRPKLVFMSPGKTIFAFFRDSLYFWTARFYGIGVACELAGRMFYILEQNVIGRLYGCFVLRKMRYIRVLGKKIVEDFAAYGIFNTLYSDNGVEIPETSAYREVQEDGSVRLLFVGTHSQQKGFEDLVEAFSYLKGERGYPVSLHTIGEWMSAEFQRRMVNMVKSLDVENSIFFHGLCHGRDKWKIFEKTQIFVLPSYNEGQPLVVLEALGCGLPVVSTNVGVIPETVTNGENGYLFEPGDINGLKAGLEKLITEKELRKRISKSNLSLFERRFSQKKYLEAQVDLLTSAAKEGFQARGQKWVLSESRTKRIQ